MSMNNIGNVQQSGVLAYSENKESISGLEVEESLNINQEYGSGKVVTEEGEVSLNTFVDEMDSASAFLDEYGAELLANDPQSLELMNRMMSGETLTDAEKEQLYEGVCAAVKSHFEYESDNGEEYATFQESVDQLLSANGQLGTLKGDCEDPVNFTANLLYAMGFSSDEVNVNVDVGTAESAGHSVLGLTLGGKTNVYDFSGNTETLDGFEFSYNNSEVNSDQDYTLGGEEGLTTASWFSDVVESVVDFVTAPITDTISGVEKIISGDIEEGIKDITMFNATDSMIDSIMGEEKVEEGNVKKETVAVEDTTADTTVEEDTTTAEETTTTEDTTTTKNTTKTETPPQSTGGLHIVG